MFVFNRYSKIIAVLALLGAFNACSMFSGRETAGQYVDDTTITAKIKEAYVADKQVHASQVNVETMQGVVQLSGFVDSAHSEARAVELARNVKGVRDVKDDIVIRSTR